VREDKRVLLAFSMVAVASIVLAHVGRTRCAKLSEMKVELKLGMGETQSEVHGMSHQVEHVNFTR
jgi:hypothetical protein